MKTWPALDVGRLKPASTTEAATTENVGAGFSRPDLFQAALLDYDIAAIDDDAAETWRVFFHTADERDRAHRGVASEFPELSVAPIDVADEDWAARSQSSLRAIRVGNLVIAPPWDVADPGFGLRASGFGLRSAGASAPASPTTIIIQPSMGFGTGHHATTRLCLAALQRLDLRGRSAIDVGTGSGVLAIAAHLLGATPVVAIDDDPDAIQSARENVGMNDGTSIDVRVVDLRTAELPTFDVVLANLTGGLLIQAAPRLQDLAVPAGRLVLSGFMRHEEAGVLDAFAAFAVAHRAEEEEWLCVTLHRP